MGIFLELSLMPQLAYYMLGIFWIITGMHMGVTDTVLACILKPI